MVKGVPHLVTDSLPNDLGRTLSAKCYHVVSVKGNGRGSCLVDVPQA